MVMIKLSDWVADQLVLAGFETVFMVTGGGAMHLNQSFGSHPKLKAVFNHHEQACAMGADAYGRLKGSPALVNVTSGPGGTNAITGVYGAFVDSIPMLVVSGQVKFETTVRSTGLPLRQYGDQELDIEPLVTPVTKYAAMVEKAEDIRYHLEKALYLIHHGRPGPCWLDIPLDIQSSQIDPSTLRCFDPAELHSPWDATDVSAAVEMIFNEIEASERPVIFAGAGVRLSGAHDDFIRSIEALGVPVVTGWNAHDVLATSHPLNCGRPGTIGDRAGNFTVQNADLLIILGSRLNIRQVSYNWQAFAKRARKIWVEIDPLELEKPNVQPDVPILADLADLLPELARRAQSRDKSRAQSWLAWCKERCMRYPVVEERYETSTEVNPYVFMQRLFNRLPEAQICVAGNGSACVIGFQASDIKAGQRFWTNSGCASMGYDLPAAIGASVGAGGKSVICLAGDGSIMMNLQELQTIKEMDLPIKIFVLNNAGYISISQTHKNFFNGREIGASPNSGVSFPNFCRLAAGFDMKSFRLEAHDDIDETVQAVLSYSGPVICDVVLDPDQGFEPKLSSRVLPDGRMESPSLEDMAPFLSREELAKNIID